MRIGRTIYLDHQATTPVDSTVLAQMIPYFSERFGNPHSADHVMGWAAAHEAKQAAKNIADLIGADEDEIIFTSGATESNNMALLGLVAHSSRSRRRVLYSAIEHKSVLACCRVIAERFELAVQPIPVDHEGFVDTDALQRALDDDVLAVCVMSVNNEIGTVQDLEQISCLCKHHGVLLFCDAAQAPEGTEAGYLARYADALSLSAHKMYGPKGVGTLFLRRELHNRVEPLIYGGGQQSGLRSGTVAVPLCVGMGAAAALIRSDEVRERKRKIRKQRDRFVDHLQALPFPVVLNGPRYENRHCANANVRFQDFSAADILAALQPRLAASTGSACTSGIPEPSHVLRAIGLSPDEAESSIRFSLGRLTSDEDLDEAVAAIASVLTTLAGTGTR
jgi:cysteine desulfurase